MQRLGRKNRSRKEGGREYEDHQKDWSVSILIMVHPGGRQFVDRPCESATASMDNDQDHRRLRLGPARPWSWSSCFPWSRKINHTRRGIQGSETTCAIRLRITPGSRRRLSRQGRPPRLRRAEPCGRMRTRSTGNREKMLPLAHEVCEGNFQRHPRNGRRHPHSC